MSESILSRWQRIRAKNDFSYFNDQFAYPPPQYPPASMHREWEEILQNAYGNIHKLLLLASRGAAKSERVTINYPLWMIGRNSNLRISLVSTPQDKAVSFLGKITTRIEEDAKYHSVFGNLKPINPRLWRTDAITVKRDIASKDASISAIGTMGQAVSKRCDIIVVDDPLDNENTRTEYQRESMKQWFNDALDPTLEPSGLLIVILTPWHEDDLSQYLMKKEGWIVMKYPAIVEPEKNLDEWLKSDDPKYLAWPEKYGYRLPLLDHNGKPLLDENGRPRIISFLRDKYNANVDAFMSQYLLDPFSVTGTLFNEEWIRYFNDVEFKNVIPNCMIYQGWDLAISLDERADYTCCATVAWDMVTNTLYILDIYRDKITPLEQFAMVKQNYVRWSVVCGIQQVTIESDQYQASLAMGLVATTTLPIVESKSKGKRKLDRIGLLAPHFRNGRIRVHESMKGGEFVYEYKRFPKSSHEDQLDALEKALEPILGQTGSGPLTIEELNL